MRDILNNATIMKEIGNEKIIWSSTIDKLNHPTGHKQQRDILLTDKHFYNIKDEKII